jgi:hypothetical protein
MTRQREIEARIKWLREQIVMLQRLAAQKRRAIAKFEGRVR